MTLIKHFIDGKIFEGTSKRTSKVFNPATGEETSKVNLASKADVDLAVEKAKRHLKIGQINLLLLELEFFLNLKNL